MAVYKFIKTLPGEDSFKLFEELPLSIYEKGSPRFILGHDPVNTHLEGCYVLLLDEKPIGRFALYENPALTYKEERAACIGSYECVKEDEAAKMLLNYAKQLATERGFTWLIGPMEGSTWNNYRFSQHNNEPNFFMEPFHHEYYNDQFSKAGFETISSYHSNLTTNLEYDVERLNQFEQFYKDKGATFRNLDMSNLDEELNKIGALSLSGFANNFLYTPIALSDFVIKYKGLANYFDPTLVWIVENENQEIQAFIFAIKDHLDPTGESLIIKSLVRDKETPLKGIGSYLTSKITQMAHEQGYKKVIHAFMISTNESFKISNKYSARVVKSYNLYGVKL